MAADKQESYWGIHSSQKKKKKKKEGCPCFLPLYSNPSFTPKIITHSVLFFPYICTAKYKNCEAQNITYQPLGAGGLWLRGTELLLRCFLCKSSLAQQFYYLPHLSHLSPRSNAAQRAAIYSMKQLTYRACNLCKLKQNNKTQARFFSCYWVSAELFICRVFEFCSPL